MSSSKSGPVWTIGSVGHLSFLVGCSATRGQQFQFCFFENVPPMLTMHFTPTRVNAVDIYSTGKEKTMSCVVMFAENVA